MLIFGLILVDLIHWGDAQVINWASNQTAGPIRVGIHGRLTNI